MRKPRCAVEGESFRGRRRLDRTCSGWDVALTCHRAIIPRLSSVYPLSILCWVSLSILCWMSCLSFAFSSCLFPIYSLLNSCLSPVSALSIPCCSFVFPLSLPCLSYALPIASLFLPILSISKSTRKPHTAREFAPLPIHSSVIPFTHPLLASTHSQIPCLSPFTHSLTQPTHPFLALAHSPISCLNHPPTAGSERVATT